MADEQRYARVTRRLRDGGGIECSYEPAEDGVGTYTRHGDSFQRGDEPPRHARPVNDLLGQRWVEDPLHDQPPLSADLLELFTVEGDEREPEPPEPSPRCATCKLVIAPIRGEDVIPEIPGAIVYFHQPEDCIKALRRVIEAADHLIDALATTDGSFDELHEALRGWDEEAAGRVAAALSDYRAIRQRKPT